MDGNTGCTGLTISVRFTDKMCVDYKCDCQFNMNARPFIYNARVWVAVRRSARRWVCWCAKMLLCVCVCVCVRNGQRRRHWGTRWSPASHRHVLVV